MKNPLVSKLSSFAELAPADVDALDRLCANEHSFKAGQDLITEGESPEQVFLLIEGWACRYKILPAGERQIMAYLIPGDLCDIHIFILREMDHSIALLSDARVAAIPKAQMSRRFATVRPSRRRCSGRRWSTRRCCANGW